MRMVVIGGDAAGITAASHVRRARPDAEIVVLERTPYTSYSMCGIPAYIGEEIATAADLVVRWPEQLRQAGIDVRTGVEAVAVDAEARTVATRDVATGAAASEAYDVLLLANGAHPALPPLPGVEHAQVVHTLDEGEALRTRLDAGGPDQRVVVVGAGYIGLELAEALVHRGLDARLVDLAEQVMPSLDPPIAARVAEALEQHGVALHLGEGLVEVRLADDGSREVVTTAGRYPADTVVLALGAAPNVELAASAGCALGDSGAVAVDGRMRTSVPGIWAAGDVVESRHLVTGRGVNIQLGTHANKQGKVAGIDIASQPGDGAATFPGVVGTAITKVCATEIARTGVSAAEAEAAGLEVAEVRFEGTAKAGYMPDPGHVEVVMRAEVGSGRIVGCQLVGGPGVGKRIDVAATWVQLGVSAPQAQFLDLSYAPPFGGVWDVLAVGARKLTKELGLDPQL